MPHPVPASWLRNVVVVGALVAATAASAQERAASIDDAQFLFYNAQYVDSQALAATIAPSDEGAVLALDDVQSSALLFEIKRLLKRDRKASAAERLKHCVPCPDLLARFARVTTHGQAVARARLKEQPEDPTALFFLGKLDLNYVWLQLDPLGRKTGWNEYWEARRSLDALLKQQPNHVRGRVARAWMEYIVDTKLPWGTEWLLGGGDRKKALVWIRDAAGRDADRFVRTEAEFALWEMLVRERRLPEALEVAARLSSRFPENKELTKFVETKGRQSAEE